uniref:Bromodomain-containing protein n=1 Tax=Pyramimonas obovata TaxID=1411642 RepID=A0A7S0WMB4_9CHLO|mmetsp:Transcript_30607/g.66799  ORF Transcript_30607/g.66799 Transcript_30607/m.66799 type:complete len:790 (+) Transcript_30607:428-2797(+)|eukprot:CAMPEP_0118948392 /NCGR_PEP_ID=MMETSP1169-20130426/47744_1 /TAXON_ID=36882 /ORGANISM="Pyramimonas obovata, Strain CCMP722" /LENGTH=789 /DNA_ID=CAMNT_0006894801 /DNA_START=384 /DNA_END=2753 /DNA_ORIENTATION=-
MSDQPESGDQPTQLQDTPQLPTAVQDTSEQPEEPTAQETTQPQDTPTPDQPQVPEEPPVQDTPQPREGPVEDAPQVKEEPQIQDTPNSQEEPQTQATPQETTIPEPPQIPEPSQISEQPAPQILEPPAQSPEQPQPSEQPAQPPIPQQQEALDPSKGEAQPEPEAPEVPQDHEAPNVPPEAPVQEPPEDAPPAASDAEKPPTPAAPLPPVQPPVLEQQPQPQPTPQPAFPPKLVPSRGEVIMTVEQAKTKKVQKGYVFVPVAPVVVDASMETPGEDARKRQRRATAKALEFQSMTPRSGKKGATPTFARATPSQSSGPAPSSTSETPEDRARRKEEKRRLKEELARIRAVQLEAQQKESNLKPPIPPVAATPQAQTPYTQTPSAAKTPAVPPSVPKFPPLLTPSPSAMSFPDSAEFGRAKRTPKANQMYNNPTEFVTGNEKLPPPEKLKPKSSLKRSHSKLLNPQEQKRKKVEADRRSREDSRFKLCDSLLRSVLKNRFAWPFMEPVNAEALGIHDYYTIVKKPMDFKTIRGKLESKIYLSPLEFAEDMRQVFINCHLYNKVESDVGKMGTDVSNDFEKRWASSRIAEKCDEEKIRRFNEDEEINNTPTTFTGSLQRGVSVEDPSSMEGALVQLQSQLKMMQQAVAKRKGQSLIEERFTRPMTFEEKRALSGSLEQLPADKLGRVVEIIQESSNQLGDESEDTLELDIDTLDPETLWKLHRYAQSCLKGTAKKNSAKRHCAGTSRLIEVPDQTMSGGGSVGDFMPMPGLNGGGGSPHSSSGSGSSSSSG